MIEERGRSLALFDCDGTVTARDSLLDFLLYTMGPVAGAPLLAALVPAAAARQAGLLSDTALKSMCLSLYFRRWPYRKFALAGQRYARERLPAIIRQPALDRIIWHREQGHTVCLVSASCAEWLEPWCRGIGIHCLANTPEISSGRLTGRIAGVSCYGREKVRRIREAFDCASYMAIYAYGDSRADRPMLSMAHQAYYRIF